MYYRILVGMDFHRVRYGGDTVQNPCRLRAALPHRSREPGMSVRCGGWSCHRVLVVNLAREVGTFLLLHSSGDGHTNERHVYGRGLRRTALREYPVVPRCVPAKLIVNDCSFLI